MKYRWRVSDRNHLCNLRQQGRDLLIVRAIQPLRKPVRSEKKRLHNFGYILVMHNSIEKFIKFSRAMSYIPFYSYISTIPCSCPTLLSQLLIIFHCARPSLWQSTGDSPRYIACCKDYIPLTACTLHYSSTSKQNWLTSKIYLPFIPILPIWQCSKINVETSQISKK